MDSYTLVVRVHEELVDRGNTISAKEYAVILTRVRLAGPIGRKVALGGRWVMDHSCLIHCGAAHTSADIFRKEGD